MFFAIPCERTRLRQPNPTHDLHKISTHDMSTTKKETPQRKRGVGLPYSAMRTATRDVQHFSSVHLANDIAVGLSANNRRLCLIEAHVSRTRHTEKRQPPTETKASRQSSATADRSSYWHQTAATLSKENATLTHSLTEHEERYTRQQESIKRLSRARAVAEEELATARREILRLTVCGNAILLPTAPPVKVQSIPVNMQGKDGMYWYQMCRTIETQYIQRTAELQASLDKLIETASSRGGPRASA